MMKMNHTKTIIQTILLLFVSNIIMAQSPIYLEVGDCTKEMHYTHTNSSNYFGEYYDYHFALNDYETVTLEVSKNSLTNLTFSELSRQKITTCGSYNFGQQFKYETINTLQNGQQEVYIVKQTANGYSVGKVTNVTYQFFLEDDDFLRVIGKEVSFDFDGKRMYDAGEELIQEGYDITKAEDGSYAINALDEGALEIVAKRLKLGGDDIDNFMGSYDDMYSGGDDKMIYDALRDRKADGGIMDLGGLEKDYREGGFVPLGAEEKADDVPARLSKNEFVFTADAVRNAGGGDIDKGAEVMQNMMDNLESGGSISEESQGMENPAQSMFDQAQMLENRIE